MNNTKTILNIVVVPVFAYITGFVSINPLKNTPDKIHKVENISYKEYPSWQIVGSTNCSGQIYLNDFYLGEFNHETNLAVQIELRPRYLVNGLQTFKVQLDKVCKQNNKFAPDAIEIRLAGFKEGEWFAATMAETKEPNAFGKFPVWGAEVVKFSAKEINDKGEIIKMAGNRLFPSCLEALDSLSLNATTKEDINVFIKAIHTAYTNGDFPFIKSISEYEISCSLTEERGTKEENKKTVERVINSMKDHIEAARLPEFKIAPLSEGTLKFRLISGKVIEVLNSDGKQYKIVRSMKGAGSVSTPIQVAKLKGKWILF